MSKGDLTKGMPDREKVIKEFELFITQFELFVNEIHPVRTSELEMFREVLALLKEQKKEIKALRLLVEWATDCDFGFDQFYDEYERYKDEIKSMKYIDGMIHVAKRVLEDHGEFEEGR